MSQLSLTAALRDTNEANLGKCPDRSWTTLHVDRCITESRTLILVCRKDLAWKLIVCLIYIEAIPQLIILHSSAVLGNTPYQLGGPPPEEPGGPQGGPSSPQQSRQQHSQHSKQQSPAQLIHPSRRFSYHNLASSQDTQIPKQRPPSPPSRK